MARRRTQKTDGTFVADDLSTPEIDEAWVESPEPVEQLTQIQNPEPEDAAKLAPAQPKGEIETDVRKKLARKTGEDPFIPSHPAQLLEDAQKIADEKGFSMNRGTEIGARLFASARNRGL
jgi:hypothetical protein